MSVTSTRTFIREKGETLVELSLAQATQLQQLRFCSVTPTAVENRWRVSDVSRVGVVVLDGRVLHVVPKTPLESIVHMASLGRYQLSMDEDQVAVGIERSLPVAITSGFLSELERVTRQGLVKDYRLTQESASVVRGRWDVTSQLTKRPGVPLPVEITFDEFTEDTELNRILATAIRVLRRFDGLPQHLLRRIGHMEVLFAEVGSVPRGVPCPEQQLTRRTQHYGPVLQLARLILDATSWTHRDGASAGGSFLVNMAAVFEGYVARQLETHMGVAGLELVAQDRRWWLDAARSVALRPDIVISRAGVPVGVADTKYKVLAETAGSPPNADVYQAVAYAMALGLSSAHLIYVSGDVIAREVHVPAAGIRVHVHALSLDGGAAHVDANVAALAEHIRASVLPHSPQARPA